MVSSCSSVGFLFVVVAAACGAACGAACVAACGAACGGLTTSFDCCLVLLVGGGDEVWSFSGWLRPKLIWEG